MVEQMGENLLLSYNQQSDLIQLFNILASDIHLTSRSKGFWDWYYSHTDDAEAVNRFKLSALMLVVTEIGELAEGIRHNNPPDQHLPEFSSAEVEAADAIIRILDMSDAFKWRTAEALIAKLMYNKSRPYKHGKNT
jgi:NTP pyrophosphatase (non-canonical NTP hydrolase)